MVGKFIAWLLRRAGYHVMTEKDYDVFSSAVAAAFKDISGLDRKLIELDSVCISNGEDIEELREKLAKQAAPKPAEQDISLAQIFREYMFGAEASREDAE